MEQHGVQAEHVRGHVADAGLAQPVSSAPELGERRVDRLGCESGRRRGGERGDLQQGTPLAACDYVREAELLGGAGVLGRQLRMHVVAEEREMSAAGEQVVRAGTHPTGEDQPGHEPAATRLGGQLVGQRCLLPADGVAEAGEECPCGTAPGVIVHCRADARELIDQVDMATAVGGWSGDGH